MARKLNIPPKSKAYIDEYYANGMNSYEAYLTVNQIEELKDTKEKNKAAATIAQARKNYPKYVRRVERKIDRKHGKMRDKLVEELDEVLGIYTNMVDLAMKDELSEKDEEKFRRLRSIMSTSDYNKAVELIGKLTGSFEPEKVEVSNTFKVSWGGDARLQENNKPVIDAEYEDVDE